jgi:transposase InsO family protein
VKMDAEEHTVAWGQKGVSEQRLAFVVRARSGAEEIKALCEEFQISRPTGYTWLKRYQECERLAQLGEKSRRPHRSPQQTSQDLEHRVVSLRSQYPDWGAKKIRVLLEREGIQLPRITVHRIMARNGLIAAQDQHRPAPQRFERESPNQLWQMDFKGMPEIRKPCLPLVILDDHSRYLTGLFGLEGTKAHPVRDSLELVFQRAGLPDAMLMDHGTPWWNMQSHCGWTWLLVWLLKQDIRIYLSGYRHPQTQGKVERCNGSLESAMVKRRRPAGQDWQPWLDAYRHEHNHIRPHEALQMSVPADRWTPSSRPFRADPPPFDYADPANVQRMGPNGNVTVRGRSYFVSQIFSGEYVQVKFVDDRAIVYFYRTAIRELDLMAGTSHHFDLGQALTARTRGLIPRPIGGSAPATPSEKTFP